MFQPGSILGSTFFASREPVRDPRTLEMINTCRAMASKDPSMAGSVSLRRPHGQLVSADTSFSTMAEDHVLDLKDYDPVRRTSMVIGMKEPTQHVALHWLALRTHPGYDVSLLVFKETPPKGIKIFSSKLLHGSFDEAMEAVKAMKEAKVTTMFLTGVGLLLLSKDLEALKDDLASLSGGKKGRKKAGPKKGLGQKRKKRKHKERPSKKKTHYKRGPTRRKSKGRR